MDRQLDAGEVPASPFITKQPSFKKKKNNKHRHTERQRRPGGAGAARPWFVWFLTPERFK